MFDPDEDDLRNPIEGRRHLGRRYLPILGPILLVLGVVATGIAGRLPAGDKAVPTTAAAVATAAFATSAASAPASAPASGPVSAPSSAPAVGASVSTDTSIAAIGSRVFYTVSGVRIESLVSGGSDNPATVVSAAPCEAIGQLAAAGQTLVYVVSKHGAPGVASCEPLPRLEWTLWALDVRSGERHRLAAGTAPATGSAAGRPVHVAVADGMYAYDHPTDDSTDAAKTVDIEVHSLPDNALVWRTTVTAQVQALMIGGNKVSIVTSGWGVQQLFIGGANEGRLELISSQSQGGSLSRDGRYYVWDAGEPAPMRSYSTLQLTDLRTGVVRDLGLSIGAPGPPSIDPAVSATSGGPVVAWYAPLPHGGISIRFVDPSHPAGGWIATNGLPAWMSVEGERLIWIERTPDGSVGIPHAVDLSTVR